MNYITTNFLESSRLLVTDKKRIENILFNAKIATAIASVGVTIEITFTNKKIIDENEVIYILPLTAITSKELQELLIYKRLIEDAKRQHKNSNYSNKVRPRQRANKR